MLHISLDLLSKYNNPYVIVFLLLKNGKPIRWPTPTQQCDWMFFFCFKYVITQRIVFKRGNLVGDDHPLLAVAEVGLSLRCSFPSTIVLIADEPGMRMIPFHQYGCRHILLILLSFKSMI